MRDCRSFLMEDGTGERACLEQRGGEIGCFARADNEPSPVDEGSVEALDYGVNALWGKIYEDIATENDVHIIGVIDEGRIRIFDEIQLRKLDHPANLGNDSKTSIGDPSEIALFVTL